MRTADEIEEMTPKERHHFIKEVFNAALELKPAERSQYIRQACNNDNGLISEVEGLLTSDADEEFIGGLSKEISGRLLGSLKREDESGLIGKTIKGRFRIDFLLVLSECISNSPFNLF